MKKSESISEIAKALVQFKTEHPKISLDEEVLVKSPKGNYTFRFASLPHIKDLVEPYLFKNGLVVSQAIEEGGKLTSLLMHTSGEYFESTMDLNELNQVDSDGTVTKSGPQEYGKIVSYGKRYAYCAVLGLIGDSAPGDKIKPKQQKTGEATPAGASEAEKPWLNKNTTQWTAAITTLCNGTTTMEELLNTYKINKDNKNELLNAKRDYVSTENISVFTKGIAKEINDAVSVANLEGIYAKYPGLKEDVKFLEALGMKKTILRPTAAATA